MRISDLGYLPDSRLPEGSSLFRIQWARKRPTTVVRGPLKLAPAGAGLGRFDLTSEVTAYFAEAPETAVYEVLARREATMLSLGSLSKRRLVTLHTTRSLQMADLRVHANHFPVLQSLRYSETCELAAHIRAAGYDGATYASAQHPGMDCYVLFEPALDALRATATSPLMDPTGRLHKSVFQAVNGSRVPLVP